MILSTAAKAAVVAAVVAVLVIGAVLAFGVLEEAQARYPTLAIQNPDPFGRDQIVTNVDELRNALDDCEATIF